MEHKSSVRVFENEFLEKFTHVHPIIPLMVWAPVVVACAYASLSVDGLSVSSYLSVGLLGFFSWTFVEYLLHRYLFHFESETAFGQRIHFLVHGIHHVDPQDPTRLVMPPLLGIPIASCLFLIFRLSLGPVWVYPYFSFFLVGYLCYDYTHFALHHFKPRTRLGIWLKKNHMSHHYIQPNAHWGVSSPLWDFVFGTLDRPVARKQSSLSSKDERIRAGSATGNGQADPIS